MPRTGRGRGVPQIDAPAEQQGDRQALVEAQQAAPPGVNPRTGEAVDPNMLADQVARGQGLPQSPRRLGDPTARPDEPLSAGSPIGPGPNSVNRRPRMSATFSDLAYRTDDPAMLEIAIAMQRIGA
jgi:hypothetical protein